MKKTVAIIHYNTPDLTEAAILSLRKQCKEDYAVVVFDNSDKRPFTKKMKSVRRIDNTKGQLVDFDVSLAFCKAGISIAAKIAMMAMTTRSSINVNDFVLRIVFFL